MKKRIIALGLAFALVAGLFVGCGQQGGNSGENSGDTSGEKKDAQFITIVTGGTGGTYYPVGTIFTTLWNEKIGDKVKASVQSSGGSVENLNMLKNGEAQLGIAMANLTLFAYEGTGRFEGNQFENVRFISALWPDVTQMVVTENSGINSIADIKGHTFSVGAAGSGTEYSTKLILKHIAELNDDEYTPEYLGYSDSSSAMQNGQIDGMNAEGGLPTSAVSEIAASKTKIKLLEFTDEDYEKMHEVAPYYGRFVVPAGTYTGIDQDVPTIGIRSTLICSADLDEDIVYELTKTIYENYESIIGSHKALEAMGLDQAVDGLPPVPLHKGALRYYEEKGIEIPDGLK